MPSNEPRGDICKAITSFISWLARLLSSFFMQPQPLEELPIVTSGSQQTIALLQAFNVQEISQPSHRVHACPAGHQPPDDSEAPNADVQAEKRTIRDRSATLPIKATVAREKPLSNYPTGFRWTSPILQPEDDWDQAKSTAAVRSGALHDQEATLRQGAVNNRIGDLGTRRGFKGKPLVLTSPGTTDSLRSRSSSLFLSLPKGFNFSPRSFSATSLDGSVPSTPRTPLEAMTSRVRSVSLSVVSWSPGPKTPPVPTPPLNEIDQELQDLYDSVNPFAASGDTFFLVNTDPQSIPHADLCHFGLYRKFGMVKYTHKRSRMEGRKNVPDGLHGAFTNARMKTAIYDLLTADVAPPARAVVPISRAVAQAAIATNSGVQGRDRSALNVDVSVQAVTSPTIVLTRPTTEPVNEGKELGKKNSSLTLEVPSRAKDTKKPRSRFAEISNTTCTPPDRVQREDINVLNELTLQPPPSPRPTVEVFAPPLPVAVCFGAALPSFQQQPLEYAEFPKVVYEQEDGPKSETNTTSTIPFPGDVEMLFPATQPKRSSLRPLVLPARVASRLSARVGPVPQDDKEKFCLEV